MFVQLTMTGLGNVPTLDSCQLLIEIRQKILICAFNTNAYRCEHGCSLLMLSGNHFTKINSKKIHH